MSDRGKRNAREKVVSLPELLDWADGFRDAGKRVVFTNGVFDLLHTGHLRLLESAARLGDGLIVAINRDRSVRKLKGPSRPLVPFRQRAALVAGFEMVDRVIGFSGETPIELIELVRPAVLAKGGDWPVERIVGREVVESYGGTVVSLPLIPGRSTTDVVERIRTAVRTNRTPGDG